MDDAETMLAELIRERLAALSTNTFAAERDYGLAPDALRSVLRGSKKTGTGINRAQQICEALGLEFYIGPPRSTGPVETVVLGNEDFAPIPRLDARVSAGPGAENGDVQVIEKLAFRRDWLDRMGVDPAQAVLVQVSGDSMTPGLHDGDLALIDRRRNKVRNGHVYALTDTDGSTRVKRIDLLPNGLILRSDAPSYPAEFRPCDDANRLRIIGQVVWSGHTWG